MSKLTSFMLAVVFVALSILNPGSASAISGEQKSLFQQNVLYFDTAPGNVCNSSGGDVIPAGTLPSFIPEPYNGAFTQAANAHNVAPALIAALFSEENALGGDTHDPDPPTAIAGWANFIKRHPNPNSGWPTSSAGARGPFQFIPSTWTGLGYDISDINNLAIAADAAATYAERNGATKDKPTSEWRNFIFSYNHADWYVNAVLEYYDYYNSQPSAAPSDGAVTVVNTPTTGECFGSAAGSGDISQTAVSLSWPEPFDQKPADEKGRDSPRTPTPAYVSAMQQYNKAGYSSTNGLGDDCGIFVATVMHMSGADPDYPDSYTVTQAQYVVDHPEKYEVIYPATSTADLKPGDILILSPGTTKDASGNIHPGGGGGATGHTFIYVGTQAGGYNTASASLNERSANLGFAQLADGRGQYMIARLK